MLQGLEVGRGCRRGRRPFALLAAAVVQSAKGLPAQWSRRVYYVLDNICQLDYVKNKASWYDLFIKC
jgi:hypothetical protein